MSKLAFVPNLFLEVLELTRAFDFVDTYGFRKNILQNSLSFGLIKNQYTDPSFLNGQVSQDVDDTSGNKTIKIKDLYAVDKDGNFIYYPQVNQLVVPSDGNFYWVRASYQQTSQELGGSFTIATNGNLTASGVDLTQIFRGQPNFATRIKFLNSTGNLLEYDVLSVTDATHAVLQHPGNAIGAPSLFVAESNLTLAIVGTFTPGYAIPSGDKYPFKFDYASVELVVETSSNVRPSYVQDREFYLARIKVSGSTVLVQDKRIEYWKTKAGFELEDVDTNLNPLIGIEAVKYNQPYTPLDSNIMEIAWGMRSNNWSINASSNTVTFTSGNGGKYKTVANFTDHDFDGWRLYTINGTYRKILNSVKVGSAINLTLDVLDVDDYSSDGGITTLTGYLICVPNAEEIIIQCKPYSIDPITTDAQDAGITPEFIDNITKEVSFPINTAYARIELIVNRDPYTWYSVLYKYKSHKKETSFELIPSDTTTGYIIEDSFDPMSSDLISATYYTYNNTYAAFIRLKMNANAYKRFVYIINRGDDFEVDTISTLASVTSIPLVAGTSKAYKYITGSFSLTNDTTFNLQSIATNPAVRDYNIFEIHFNCTSLNLAAHNIYITQDFGTSGAIVLKTINVGDIFEMQNRDNGIYFKCTYDANLNKWIIWQSYDLGQPKEIKMVPGDPSLYFDGSGVGNIKGWYGWNIFSALTGRVPIGIGSFTEASGTYTRNFGDTGGQVQHQLTVTEIPAHTHTMSSVTTGISINSGTTGISVTNAAHDHRLFFRARSGAGGTDYKTIEIDAPVNANLPHSDGTTGSDSSYTAYNESVTVAATVTDPGHTHAVTDPGHSHTINSTGGGNYHENMPPWYALTFAQKQY